MENKTVRKKRRRSLNWINIDEQLLTKLIIRNVYDIENKKLDANTNNKKIEVWSDILNRFNSKCIGAKRTVPQLRNKWKIIKMAQKGLKSELWNSIVAARDSTGDFAKDRNHESADRSLDPNNQTGGTNENSLPGSNDVNPMNEITDELRSSEDELMEEVSSSSSYDEDLKNLNFKEQNEDNENYAARIANIGIKCREELHAIQMENERKRSRNLDLESVLLKKKIKYYVKKTKLCTLEN